MVIGAWVLSFVVAIVWFVALGVRLLRADFEPLEMSSERKFWYIFALGRRKK